ncbi:MAG: hypothetical protein NTY64_15290 [Deltaproteobacteria bacterium]|nr:hypothetical protein [Deltaproteobacteria bacterium]
MQIMFNDDEEKWAHFRDLEEIMEKAPRQEPPEGFTARVMARLPEGKATVRRFSFRRPFGMPDFATDLLFGFRRPMQKTECAYYFFLTGFAHLILAFVLFLGMRALYGNVAGSSWIRVQPFVVFFLSVWFFTFSILLWRRHPAGLKAARIAIFIYLEIIVINGALPLIKFGKQLFLLPFWGLAASCLIIGGYLALTLQRNFGKP